MADGPWRTVLSHREATGHPQGFTVWGQSIPLHLPTREVERARPEGEKVRTRPGQSSRLRPDMESYHGEEGQERYRERKKRERGEHIQEGSLEEVVREKKCTHPEWCFQGLTRSNLTGVQARDQLGARKEAVLG